MGNVMKDNGSYAQHARFWDWSGHDRSEENEYWLRYAARHGRNVLIPMCAWGETGTYMAQRGLHVTAFDLTPEMIAEGRKRYGSIASLRLLEGDVTDFHFDVPSIDFCFTMDLEVLPSLEEVRKALRCIHKHLRDGGCLAIKPNWPPEKSDSWPLQTYLPVKQMYPGMRVWKTGNGHNDAKLRKRYISQTFYIEHEGGRTESFDSLIDLQCYTRKEWYQALRECGYEIAREHKGHGLKKSYSAGDTIEAIKKEDIV